MYHINSFNWNSKIATLKKKKKNGNPTVQSDREEIASETPRFITFKICYNEAGSFHFFAILFAAISISISI